MDIESLERRVRSEPDNVDAQVDFIRAYAQIHGPDIFLEPLTSVNTWKRCPNVIQDLAIQEVDRRLPAEFEYRCTKIWGIKGFKCACVTGPHRRQYYCQECKKDAEFTNEHWISYRLATFVHKDMQYEMNLVPGFPKIDETQLTYKCSPFLVGRWPVVWHHIKNLGFVSRGDYYPITGFTFDSVLSDLDTFGGGLSLPTIAMAAHYSSHGITRFSGDLAFDRLCWHRGNSDFVHGSKRRGEADIDQDGYAFPQIQPVNLHELTESWNAFGLVDTLGNVHEWCIDVDSQHEGAHAIFGGSYIDQPRYLFRNAWQRGRSPQVGFRAIKYIPGLP